MILIFKNNITCILGINNKWEDIDEDWIMCCTTDRGTSLIDLILIE